MSNFVKHTNCPKCMSKDNLGVYDDGHTYCFGCGYRTPPTGMTMSVYRRLQIQQPNKTILDFHYAPNIPKKAMLWLKSYGITDEEIVKYDIGFDPDRESLVFPFKGELGEICYASTRYFGEIKNHPKSKTIGIKKDLLTIGKRDSDTLIFVEDPISAIKVGRSFSAIAVLGSHVPLEAIERATRRYKHVGLWLDPDMCLRSAKAVLRGQMLTGKHLFQVKSEMDPKYYSTEEICQRVLAPTNLGKLMRVYPEGNYLTI